MMMAIAFQALDKSEENRHLLITSFVYFEYEFFSVSFSLSFSAQTHSHRNRFAQFARSIANAHRR